MEQGKQMRFTKAELETIRHTFKGNEELLKLMRKVFLPEIDPNAPLGQIIDLWMTIPTNQLSAEEVLVNVKARNALISHIERQLLQLKALAESNSETPEQQKERIKKDSLK